MTMTMTFTNTLQPRSADSPVHAISMSAKGAVVVSSGFSTPKNCSFSSLLHRKRTRTAVIFEAISSCRYFSGLPLDETFLRFPFHVSLKRKSSSPGFRPVSPIMEWQDCKVKMEVDVPISVAYKAYSDREAIPRWMPFITSVEILEGKPELSRWSLKYKAFGRDIEFSWLARNMQPIPNQKIHWRSLEGLPNRGAVRFFPKASSSCVVELTVSYEVPQILVPVASALQPFLESLLVRGLERFAAFARSYVV